MCSQIKHFISVLVIAAKTACIHDKIGKNDNKIPQPIAKLDKMAGIVVYQDMKVWINLLRKGKNVKMKTRKSHTLRKRGHPVYQEQTQPTSEGYHLLDLQI